MSSNKSRSTAAVANSLGYLTSLRPKDFTMTVESACGHIIEIRITKADVRKKRARGVFFLAASSVCGACFLEATSAARAISHQVERLRDETRAAVIAGEPIEDIVEYATSDPLLRLLFFDRIEGAVAHHCPQLPENIPNSPTKRARVRQRLERTAKAQGFDVQVLKRLNESWQARSRYESEISMRRLMPRAGISRF
jgi:hypothetical protein